MHVQEGLRLEASLRGDPAGREEAERILSAEQTLLLYALSVEKQPCDVQKDPWAPLVLLVRRLLNACDCQFEPRLVSCRVACRLATLMVEKRRGVVPSFVGVLAEKLGQPLSFASIQGRACITVGRSARGLEVTGSACDDVRVGDQFVCVDGVSLAGFPQPVSRSAQPIFHQR